ncbi:MAG: hypothetical protein HZC42_09305 [Candidatus Eisenbacteria bacterium]|nr:hypothetical protein [Candidatus Eisenbacteria bacterium]
MMREKLFGCFNWRLIVEAVAAALVVMACAYWGRDLARGAPLRIALAVIQGAAFGFVIVRTLQSIRRLDELGQRIHFEAIVLAFAGTGIAVTAWGFLERAGLPAVRWAVWVWPLMTLLWLVGLVVVGRRYR